jgi:hypothetical protein
VIVSAQAFFELERAALDGIRAHTSGTHHKWKPLLIPGNEDTPDRSDEQPDTTD